MKQVIAFIKPAVLERVTEALLHLDGLTGMSVLDNYGFGTGKGAGRHTPEREISYFCKNIRIEVMASDAVANQVVDAIQQQAWTGERGGGKIYLLEVLDAVRVRTNERGEGAV